MSLGHCHPLAAPWGQRTALAKMPQVVTGFISRQTHHFFTADILHKKRWLILQWLKSFLKSVGGTGQPQTVKTEQCCYRNTARTWHINGHVNENCPCPEGPKYKCEHSVRRSSFLGLRQLQLFLVVPAHSTFVLFAHQNFLQTLLHSLYKQQKAKICVIGQLGYRQKACFSIQSIQTMG